MQSRHSRIDEPVDRAGIRPPEVLQAGMYLASWLETDNEQCCRSRLFASSDPTAVGTSRGFPPQQGFPVVGVIVCGVLLRSTAVNV